jgi:hypothetical protein
MIEATCTVCGEVFNPADEDDLEHGITDMGEECGGLGVIDGEWLLLGFDPDHGRDYEAESAARDFMDVCRCAARWNENAECLCAELDEVEIPGPGSMLYTAGGDDDPAMARVAALAALAG